MFADRLTAQAILQRMLVLLFLVDIIEGRNVVKLFILVRLFHSLGVVQLLLGLRLIPNRQDGLGGRALSYSIIFLATLHRPVGLIALLRWCTLSLNNLVIGLSLLVRIVLWLLLLRQLRLVGRLF